MERSSVIQLRACRPSPVGRLLMPQRSWIPRTQGLCFGSLCRGSSKVKPLELYLFMRCYSQMEGVVHRDAQPMGQDRWQAAKSLRWMTSAGKPGVGERRERSEAKAVRSGFMGRSFRFYSHTKPQSHKEVFRFVQ
jgi:hypothetical protein